MKMIFLIVFLPLINSFEFSFTCLFLGDRGCRMKCSIKCLLLDCVTENGYCDDWIHCECNEIYNVGNMHLAVDDFENVEFVDLWNNLFEASIASADIRKQIQKSKTAENYVLELLRDPYVTGDDIISLLSERYPRWRNVNSLRSRQHSLKTKFVEAGKPMKYSNLDKHLDELLGLISEKPASGLENLKHQHRLRELLRNTKKVKDLEEVLNFVKVSGNVDLYVWVKSELRGQGYGFEEDGDDGRGKKAILKTMFIDLNRANEDEILEMSVANKFISVTPNSAGVKAHVNQVQRNNEDRVQRNGIEQLQPNNKEQVQRNNKRDDMLVEFVDYLNSIPAGDVANPKYQRRLKQFFRSFSLEKIEEAIRLVKLRMDYDLYTIIKSVLRRLGYGFEEDGDSLGNGIKAIIRAEPDINMQSLWIF